MARIVPLTGTEANRVLKAAEVSENEIHTTSDQKRLFLENRIVAPVWQGAVADQAAMLALSAGTYGCWPGDKCKRSDIGTIWECITNNGGLLADWIEVTTDRIGWVTMFSGPAANIPPGYALCDGGGGRPNMVDRFVLGTATDAEIGTTGGTAAHKHAVGTLADTAASAGTPAVDGHTNTTALLTGAGTTVLTGPVNHTGTPLGNHSHGITGKTANPENGAGSTATNDVLPPWFKLAFIIRVS